MDATKTVNKRIKGKTSSLKADPIMGFL